MRVKSTVNVVITDDGKTEDVLFGPTSADVITSSYSEYESGKFSIAASGSASLSFGTVTAARVLFIRVLGDADLTLNGSADAISIRRNPDATSATPAKFYFEGTVTSAVLENPSSSAALVGYYCVAGDPT